MKAKRDIVRKYYKYVYEPWTQPILTSNGTMGGDSFAVDCPSDEADTYPAYYAFDSDTSNFVVTHNTDYYIYNNNPLNITNISISNRADAYGCPDGIIKGSNDNINWTDIVTILSGSTNWDLSTNIKFYKYYKITQSTSADWQPTTITLTATKQSVVEATEDDYDFYKDEHVYSVHREVIREYYKYVYEPWTQPALTSDSTVIDEGTITVSASSSSSGWNPYKALDGVKSGTSGAWRTENKTTGWWQVKFPYKIIIKGLTHYNSYTQSSARNVSGRFYTDSTLTNPIGDSFTAPNTNWYQTIITGIPQEGVSTDTIYFNKTTSGAYGGIGELEINAVIKTIQEATSSDYDFYVDIQVYKAFNL